MRKIVLVLAGLAVGLMLTGCAKPVQKNWAATGGSRADAMVELSYSYFIETEQPQLQESQAVDLATKRCQLWGYTSAEAFGGEEYRDQRERQGSLQRSVIRRIVTKRYQCIGQDSEATVKK